MTLSDFIRHGFKDGKKWALEIELEMARLKHILEHGKPSPRHIEDCFVDPASIPRKLARLHEQLELARSHEYRPS